MLAAKLPNEANAGRRVEPPAAGRPELVLQTGHSSTVDAVAFSPDGRWIATGSFDSTIKIWQPETGRELRALSGHSGAVRSLASSPDGRLLASGGNDKTIRIWDVANGGEVRRLDVQDSIVGAVAFSPDGQRLASSGPGNSVIVWDAASGKELLRLPEHTGAVTALAFSRDGQLLASGSSDKTVKIWDLVKGKRVRNLTGHTEEIKVLAFSDNGETLASGSLDKTVRVWKTANGKPMAELKGHTGKVFAASFTPDGKLMSADSNGAVKVWDLVAKREASSLSARVGADFTEETIASAIFSADGKFLAAGNADRTASLYSAETGEKLETFENRTGGYLAIAFSADRRWLAAAGSENSIKLWDLQTGQSLPPLTGHTGFVTSLVFDRDNRLISASVDGTIRIWDALSQKQIALLKGDKGNVSSVAVGKSGAFLASGGLDKRVGIWDPKTRQPMFLSGHTGEVTTVAVSPDEKLIASGSTDKTIRFWDAASGAPLRAIENIPDEVDSVAFSPDGKFLASGGADKTVRIWDSATGAPVGALSGHTAKIRAVAFTPDGKQIVSGGEDKTLRVWGFPEGREERVLTGHYGVVSSLAISSDGNWLASASDDGSVNLWDRGGNVPVSTLVSLKNSNDWLVVTPQGFFDGSSDAWSQLLWRFRGDSFAVSPVEVFFEEFYQPGLLANLLRGKRTPAGKNIAARDRRQPRLEMSLAESGKNAGPISERVVKVKINVSEAAPDLDFRGGSGAKDVRLFRNGSLVRYWDGNVIENGGTGVLEAEIPVVEGRNVLTAYAFNNDNIKSTDDSLLLNGASNLRRNGKIYIIAIGVGQYANPAFNLKFVASDATNFGDLLEAKQRELGTGDAVQVTTLLNRDATKANILDALKKLAGAAQPEDSVIVYFSGHGVARGDRFYMVPYDLGYSGPLQTLTADGYETVLNTITQHGISDLDLEDAFRPIDAKNLMLIIDACGSGRAIQAPDKRQGPMNSKGLAQLGYEKGMYILTATQDAEDAYVSRNLERSYLNYALLDEGLRLKAADNNPADGKVVLREWFDYASGRVPVLRDEVAKGLKAREQSKGLTEANAKPPADTPPPEQRPRAFYRRQAELQPMVVARFGP